MSTIQLPEEILADVVMVGYGFGNLRSAVRGLECVRVNIVVSGDPADFGDADGIVLSGVGAFSEGMENAGPFHKPLVEAAADGTPVFSICLGMQVLLTSSEEADHAGEGEVEGLDLIPGRNVRFDEGQKVPYMDWNKLNVQHDHPLAEGVDGEYAYFVHSYHADPDDEGAVVASTDYGVAFPTVVTNEAGTVLGTQFHPEKSGETGLTILRNFVEFCAERQAESACPDDLLSSLREGVPMQAVTLGPAGTCSHRATRAVANDVALRGSVTSIVQAVTDGLFGRDVVPIENSIEGSVTEGLDAAVNSDVSVVQEVITPIHHTLLAQSANFDVVASHSQALAQCRTYLEENYPDAKFEAVASTARGVGRARADPTVAGIGHPDNVDDDLEIIAEDIQDQSSNATRFLVIGPESARSDAGGKSSLVVYPNTNYPGLLLELLEAFAERDINPSCIGSRPSGNRLGDYLFHIDTDAGLYEERMQGAPEEVEGIASNGWVHVLGSCDTRHVLH